jgi:hypothetical protein
MIINQQQLYGIARRVVDRFNKSHPNEKPFIKITAHRCSQEQQRVIDENLIKVIGKGVCEMESGGPVIIKKIKQTIKKEVIKSEVINPKGRYVRWRNTKTEVVESIDFLEKVTCDNQFEVLSCAEVQLDDTIPHDIIVLDRFEDHIRSKVTKISMPRSVGKLVVVKPNSLTIDIPNLIKESNFDMNNRSVIMNDVIGHIGSFSDRIRKLENKFNSIKELEEKYVDSLIGDSWIKLTSKVDKLESLCSKLKELIQKQTHLLKQKVKDKFPLSDHTDFNIKLFGRSGLGSKSICKTLEEEKLEIQVYSLEKQIQQVREEAFQNVISETLTKDDSIIQNFQLLKDDLDIFKRYFDIP